MDYDNFKCSVVDNVVYDVRKILGEVVKSEGLASWDKGEWVEGGLGEWVSVSGVWVGCEWGEKSGKKFEKVRKVQMVPNSW